MATKQAYEDEWLPIGDAAALVGLSAVTLRRYEAAGRIAATRTPAGHRRFRRSDVEALLTRADQPEDASPALAG
ncbi:helix-turn-helix domain-containing protein [Georgenia wangjunii]|uniref:helix-turn-helix domain-containing protein n=1 Tax=Georgenia wangjunii TaxID=3117730 RepID=UPI002F26A766